MSRCAHALCGSPPICSIHLKTGRTNLCRDHYDQHFQIQADRNNHAKGLHTVDQMRAYCRKLLGTHRAPGDWWKKEVLAKAAAGELVSVFAFELASTSHRAHKVIPEREPGSDDE